MIVWRCEIDRIFVQGHAAMADMQTFIGRIGVVPDLRACPRIHSPDMIGYGYIQNAVSDDGRRLYLRCLACLKRPRKRELSNVRWSDLAQVAVTLARVISVVYRPTVGCRL